MTLQLFMKKKKLKNKLVFDIAFVCTQTQNSFSSVKGLSLKQLYLDFMVRDSTYHICTEIVATNKLN